MERIYPLHSRVDTERISAKYKKGRLEIRIPDKATALRAFYAVLFFFCTALV
jgi:HSP20 family molecular chaperone IbpA